MNHSTSKPTKAEQERLDAIHALPCLACAFEIEAALSADPPQVPPIQPFKTEADHLVDKGTRKLSGGHAATLPLCAWHHRGECLPGLTARAMRVVYGPSFALEKKAFAERYGGHRILLVETDALIASNKHGEYAQS